MSKIPKFADIKDKSVPALMADLAAGGPLVVVELVDLEAELRKIRGCYETSWPTIDGPLALKFGPEFTRFINRKPDFRKAVRTWQTFVTLFEVTPIPHPKEGLIIYRWKLIVNGEAERRRQWLIDLVANDLMRMELAS